ncbi:MAG: acetyltransferase [Gammaproteobacteria bacterium]|nr:acetyltransferase [Gammaproteobacteria bacterium]
MKLILLGGGGHATVLAEILHAMGTLPASLAALDAPLTGLLAGLPFLGGDDAVMSYATDTVQLINGLGSIADTRARTEIYQRFSAAGYGFAAVRHSAAIVSSSAEAGKGLHVLAGAIINSEARLGDNVLVNSRALVEHHCNIGDHCHIASGAVLCGSCRLGIGVHVGAGAVVKQGVSIGDGAVIAAGAVVIGDVPAHSLMAGVPAQIKRENI